MLQRSLIALALMVSSIGSALAAPSLGEVFSWATEQGLITSTETSDSAITRRDAAPLFVNVAKKYWGSDTVTRALDGAVQCKFGDLDVADAKNKNIAEACALGIIRGDQASNYNAESRLTPAQAMTIMMRIVSGSQKEDRTPWWSNYFDLAKNNGVIPEGDRSLIQTGTSIGRGKILSWIYDLMASKTIRSDANLGKNIFSENATPPAVEAKTPVAPVVKGAAAGTAMGAGSGLCAGNNSWYCHWFGLGSHSGGWSWIWWLIVAWLLWKLWMWLCCSSDDDEKNGGTGRGSKTAAMGAAAGAVVHNNYNEGKGSHKAHGAGGHHGSDDLEIIEGIGPKVAKLLGDAGVHTFTKLADMSPAEISKILSKAGGLYASMNPGTWPEQAALARDGDMKGLEALKDRLTNGLDV